MKVLIVENERRAGQFIARGLEVMAYLTTWVRNCHDARDALVENPPDVIVLDLGLRDGDGLELLREWRSLGFNEPVLILSARDAVQDRIKGLNFGADDYPGQPGAANGYHTSYSAPLNYEPSIICGTIWFRLIFMSGRRPTA